MFNAIDEALLRPGPICQVRLDLTSRCNLKCVYCAVSHPAYQGADMPDVVARKAAGSDRRPRKAQSVGTRGSERPRGNDIPRRLDRLLLCTVGAGGIPLRLTSNFAKSFDIEELEALACMDSISISIDTADRMLLRRLRRHVHLRQIMTNMTLVKAAAVKLHRGATKIRISQRNLRQEFSRVGCLCQVLDCGGYLAYGSLEFDRTPWFGCFQGGKRSPSR